MKNVPDLFRGLRDLLVAGDSCALATVVSRIGSGPREAGAMMLFDSSGATTGTVGGGLLEARVAEIARAVMDTGESALAFFSLDAAAAEEGMICGGAMEVLVARLWPAPDESVKVYHRAAQLLDGGAACLLVTLVSGEDGSRSGTVGLIGPDGALPGSLPLTSSELKSLFSGYPAAEPELVERGVRRFFLQPLRRPARAFVFGAGHVSRALVPLLGPIGFSPVVVDDRAEFADPRHFSGIAEVVLVDSFKNCVPSLGIDGESYVVVVTRGHLHDIEVTAQVIGTSARYIGMIGSRRKREGVFAALLHRGIKEGELDRIRTPVGLPIGARTPAEIAVSIASEMIAVRAGRETGREKPHWTSPDRG